MKKLILVFILFPFIFSCSARKNIPEITPHINAIRMNEILISPDIFSVIAAENSIIIPDIKGKLNSVSDEKTPPVVLAEYKTGFRKRHFLNNNFLALFPSKKKDVIFIDLKKIKVIYESKKNYNIRGIGSSHFIHYKDNKLEIINFPGGDTIFSKIIDGEKLIDCNILNDEAVLLFDKSLLIYNFKTKTDIGKGLNLKAVSPFLRIGDHIYFGDDSRALVKFSLKKGKIIWKYKFQKHLKIKPVRYKDLIVASPGDNNTYLITKRGGVKDWYRSKSGRLFDPVLMRDHLAVFLRTDDGTSINYYGLNEHSILNFSDKSLTLKFSPVYFKNNLYSVGMEGDDPLLKLIKIGNKFGSTIKLDPEGGHEVGKAVRFLINPVNMYKPDITTEIYNDKEEKILTRLIPFNNNPSFVWVPESGGNFTLKILTKEKNGIETTDIKKILVADTALMYKNLQMKLHENCRETGKGPENTNEKKD